MDMKGDMDRIARTTKSGLSNLADAIWPGRSLISGTPARGALSAEDFAALSFITGPVCQRCGQPFELDLGPDAECAACIARPPPWRQARAALVYDDVSRIPILALKRSGRRDGLKVMANWMAQAGAPLIETADLIIPVPLHYQRLVLRGYNQAGWLAGAVAKRAGKPVDHVSLKRSRPTPSQANMNARARHRNVAGAFKVASSARSRLENRHVLLVDDVMTTGATLKAASKALLHEGVTQVDVLVLARVVRETNIT